MPFSFQSTGTSVCASSAPSTCGARSTRLAAGSASNARRLSASTVSPRPGRASASVRTTSMHARDSLRALRRNFRRAGVL